MRERPANTGVITTPDDVMPTTGGDPPSRRAAGSCGLPVPARAVVLFFLVVVSVVSNTDQAATATTSSTSVVRVVRVDVPPVVRSYDAKPEIEQPPLLLGCAYALEGGENDSEDGDDASPADATTAAASGRGGRSPPHPEVAMDAAMEEVQRQRGLVVKWYFRRNPAPVADGMSAINDNEQVYQWIAGGGPEAGGGLGPLSGRVVDVTAETPRADKSVLHRVVRVDRPTAELTGEYRCQVEDWYSERRSAWHPMVVYTPERIFKVNVDDNDDDDEDDITEGSGNDGNTTTPMAPSTSSSTPPTSPKKWPTEINITCYAVGMHPKPSMSIWVNGVMQDSVSVSVTDDDGDDDESNDGSGDGSNLTTTTTTTTTVRPKSLYRNRFRSGVDASKRYAVRASKVVSLRDAEEQRAKQAADQYGRRRRAGVVDVECRMRVPGDGTGDGRWKADRPADRYYGARRSVAYKYRGGDQQPSGDAFAAVSSASSVDVDAAAAAGDDDQDADSGAGRASLSVRVAAIAACLAAALRR